MNQSTENEKTTSTVDAIVKNNKAMTLVEVIAVIVLLGLIMGVVAKGIFGKGEEAKAKLNTVKMEKVKSYLSQYRLEYNSYPPKLENLIKAPSDLKNTGKIFTKIAEEDELKDIWGFEFTYQSENNGRSYALGTLGADGVPGGEGANSDLVVRP